MPRFPQLSASQNDGIIERDHIEGVKDMSKDSNEFGLAATTDAADYLGEIAAAMTRLFGIDHAEAVGRIRQFWQAEAFLTAHALIALFHRSEEAWAKTIYYGGQPWWLDGPPEPSPYPH
jgi:hypothetical protein